MKMPKISFASNPLIFFNERTEDSYMRNATAYARGFINGIQLNKIVAGDTVTVHPTRKFSKGLMLGLYYADPDNSLNCVSVLNASDEERKGERVVRCGTTTATGKVADDFIKAYDALVNGEPLELDSDSNSETSDEKKKKEEDERREKEEKAREKERKEGKVSVGNQTVNVAEIKRNLMGMTATDKIKAISSLTDLINMLTDVREAYAESLKTDNKKDKKQAKKDWEDLIKALPKKGLKELATKAREESSMSAKDAWEALFKDKCDWPFSDPRPGSPEPDPKAGSGSTGDSDSNDSNNDDGDADADDSQNQPQQPQPQPTSQGDKYYGYQIRIVLQDASVDDGDIGIIMSSFDPRTEYDPEEAVKILTALGYDESHEAIVNLRN